ncbi:MAG: amidohydrolase family protein [Acidobacteriota bacterium]
MKIPSYIKMLVLLCICFFILVNGYSARADEVIAIKGGKIFTVTKGILEDGTVILKNGLIEAVGKDIPIPAGAKIIEAKDLYVYPGLIDSHSTIGISEIKPKAEEVPPSGQPIEEREKIEPLNADKFVIDSLNPKAPNISTARNLGITTTLSALAQGVFTGQSAIINLAGETPGEMLLKSPAGINLEFNMLRGAYPSTLMGVLAFIRQTFIDADYYQKEWEYYNKYKKGIRRPVYNKPLESLQSALNRKMPIIFSVNKENDIKRSIKIAKEFNLNYLLSGVTEGWRVLDLLKKEKRPVLLSLNFPEPKDTTGYSFLLKVDLPIEKEEKPKEEKKPSIKKEAKEEKKEEEKKEDEEIWKLIYGNAASLHKAGIKFAFTGYGLKQYGDIMKNVSKAIENGLPAEEALKAFTIYPAEIFGISDQVGSIEKGKIANIVVTKGELFQKDTTLKYLFIDGKEIEVKEAVKKEGIKPPTVDVTGTWNVSIMSPGGEMSATMTLTQSGSDVSGEFKSQMGITQISNGVVSGNEISFSILIPTTDPPMEVFFSGKVEGNSITGTIDLGPMGTAEWKATRPGNLNLLFESAGNN